MNGKSGLDLADAIDELRTQLSLSRSRAVGADIQFPIQTVTVELHVAATREGGGKAGFKVPVIDFELGVTGSYLREATHKVVIEFGEPVDINGTPIRVDRLSNIPLD